MMFRKGVAALIRNEKKEFLFVNLVAFKEQYYAVPGGGIEAGESAERAVYREIKEELGIELHTLQLVGISRIPLITHFVKPLVRDGVTYGGSEKQYFGFEFVGKENDIVLNHQEVRAYAWVPEEKFGEYLLFQNQREDTLQQIEQVFLKQ